MRFIPAGSADARRSEIAAGWTICGGTGVLFTPHPGSTARLINPSSEGPKMRIESRRWMPVITVPAMRTSQARFRTACSGFRLTRASVRFAETRFSASAWFRLVFKVAIQTANPFLRPPYFRRGVQALHDVSTAHFVKTGTRQTQATAAKLAATHHRRQSGAQRTRRCASSASRRRTVSGAGPPTTLRARSECSGVSIFSASA